MVIALGFSLIVHLTIFYGISYSFVGKKHTFHPLNVLNLQHRLTVTLTPHSYATTQQKQESATEGMTKADDNISSTNAVFSTKLATRYFTVSELDKHPVITRDISDNPPELSGYSQGGEIVLRLWIDETGKVVNVDTILSNLPQEFIDSAHAAFSEAIFLPGRIHEHTVATVMDISVSYAKTEAASTSVEQKPSP
jgi:hypothetical protein